MFSNLGSIFIRPPRQAEHVDTRAEIRRHDPDQPKRRKKDEKSDEDIFFDTDDTATISVPALAVFLDNFLNTQTQDSSAVNVETSSSQSAPLSPAAQAASAYAKAGHVAKPEMQSAPAGPAAPSLNAEDLRLMHHVRAGVETLLQKNITVLKIEKGDNFLASLAASVDKMLQSP